MRLVRVVIAAILTLASAAPETGFAADPIALPGAAASPSDSSSRAPEAPPIVVEPPVDEAPPVPPPPAAPATPAVVATISAAPTPRPKRETHGLALAAGLGFTYGGLGLQARYDVPITRSLTVSPFVSAGLFFGWLSGPAGVSAALGARHRFVVDLGIAPLDWLRFSLHGTTVAERLIFGPLLAAGYERMSERGWFWRGTLELAYDTWTTAPVPIDSHFRLFTGVAVGRRIW